MRRLVEWEPEDREEKQKDATEGRVPFLNWGLRWTWELFSRAVTGKTPAGRWGRRP